ncbi:MAG TPA: Na+/glucose cotransporter [Maribacter sp.]|uniref:sodium:solute symporter n=1 Tax=unclassified Maribacter TaxID=2615042 RepID=UPI000EE76CE2|nr:MULTISPECIES: sodium:solute symporter [unclassified Maribacter]HAF77484.1 Na+/glucose cotransporter [Maribacter sp.]|tara:strand:- start:165409 stop:167028 length:1620 start_codon:yes stop_codon:yes gene_type:complete
MQQLDHLDWISISLYFLLLVGVAIWVIRKKEDNTEDYFLAGRNVGWFVVGASIFASNIGSEHVVGLAGTGASNKLPLLIYEIHAWVVLMLGWVFLPFYARSGVFTMPEFLEKRFDARSRWVLSVFSIVAYVLTKISVTIYAGGVVVSALLGIDFWTGAIATVILTGLYTVLGGMRAVVYTETLQAILLVVGAAVLTFIGLDKVGGWGSMVETLGPEYFNMWRPATDPDFPWPSLFITSTIVGIWYWCTDQYIVQRTLTAKNIKEGRRGTIFGALLKLLPVFLFLIPGVIALTLKMRGELHWESADEAFPVLMSNLLPSGLRGLVAAGLLAALMSSLASVFNSCSTLFTVDVYKKLRPNTPEKKLVRTGQIATVFVVIIGIIWIPIMANISGVLYEYLQSVQSYIAPPITAVFLLGIFYKRINATGAFATLIMGILVAFFRIALELLKDNFDSDGILYYLGDMNFLTFGAWFFLFCLIFLVVVSLLTKSPDKEQIVNLTFGTITEEEKNKNKNSYNWIDIAVSISIVLIVIGIMVFFNGK